MTVLFIFFFLRKNFSKPRRVLLVIVIDSDGPSWPFKVTKVNEKGIL